MGSCCKCSPVPPDKELHVLSKSFIIVNGLMSIFVGLTCAIAVAFLNKTNISAFLSIDIVSLFISVIILCFIIIVVGWVAGVNNTGLGWIIYHICMVVLLLIMIVLSLSTANISSFTSAVNEAWDSANNALKSELQTDLTCCGFYNTTDRISEPCPSGADESCYSALHKLFAQLRFATSGMIFVLFILGVFIDMSGCAICVHPEKISMEEQQQDDAVNLDDLEDESNFRNPFLI